MSRQFSRNRYRKRRPEHARRRSALEGELVASLYFPGTGDGPADHPPDGELIGYNGVIYSKWLPGGFLELSSMDHDALFSFLEDEDHPFTLHTR